MGRAIMARGRRWGKRVGFTGVAAVMAGFAQMVSRAVHSSSGRSRRGALAGWAVAALGLAGGALSAGAQGLPDYVINSKAADSPNLVRSISLGSFITKKVPKRTNTSDSFINEAQLVPWTADKDTTANSIWNDAHSKESVGAGVKRNRSIAQNSSAPIKSYFAPSMSAYEIAEEVARWATWPYAESPGAQNSSTRSIRVRKWPAEIDVAILDRSGISPQLGALTLKVIETYLGELREQAGMSIQILPYSAKRHSIVIVIEKMSVSSEKLSNVEFYPSNDFGMRRNRHHLGQFFTENLSVIHDDSEKIQSHPRSILISRLLAKRIEPFTGPPFAACNTRTNDRWEIFAGIILITLDVLGQQPLRELRWVLEDCIGHVLGVHGQLTDFISKYSTPVLSLLYDSRIYPGMHREEALNIFLRKLSEGGR